MHLLTYTQKGGACVLQAYESFNQTSYCEIEEKFSAAIELHDVNCDFAT